MSKFRFLLCAGLVVLLTACASHPERGMFWGNYEQTLYNLENDPSPRTQERHLQSLRNIVETSDNRGWAPPPGVLLELAVYEREFGRSELYAVYVNRERTLYPESHPFIQQWFADVVPPPVVEEEPDSDGLQPDPVDEVSDAE